VPRVPDDALESGGHRDRDQCAEDPEQGGANQDREDDRQRVDLHRLAVDERLDQVVLDLLVPDEDREPDDQVAGEVEEGDDDPDDDAADRRAHQWDQVQEGE
jgi:hypothetical protein